MARDARPKEDLFDELRKLRGRYRGAVILHYGGSPEALDVEFHERARGGRHSEELTRSVVARVIQASG